MQVKDIVKNETVELSREDLIQKMKEGRQVDLILKEKKTDDIPPINDEVLTREEAFGKLFCKYDWRYVMAPMKLYKKSLFTSLRFALGRLHEDTFLIHHLFGACNRVVTISDKLYMYLQRDGSIMHSMAAMNYVSLIDAYIDRCVYFKGLQYKDFAHKSARSAYVQVVRFLRSGTFKDHKAELKTRIRIVTSWLLRFGDLRAIKLWYFYIRFAR